MKLSENELGVFKKILKTDDKVDDKIKDLIDPEFKLFANITRIPNIENIAKGLDEAFSAIIKDVNKTEEDIVILTDYDCDGINSAIVLEKLIPEELKQNTKVIINKRMYGNGVNFDSLDTLNIKNIKLFITGDHGSVNREEYNKLKELNPNIKILVTDHHQIQDDKSPTEDIMFVNPQMDGCDVFKESSGCTVAFITLFSYYAYKHLDMKDKKILDFSINKDTTIESIRELGIPNLELVMEQFFKCVDNMCLTVLSDVMSVIDPFNRVICKIGINKLRTDNIFISLLKDNYKLNPELGFTDLQYNVIPIINTANRTHIESMGYMALNGDLDSLNRLLINNMERKNTTDQCIKQAKSNGHIYGGVVKVVIIDTPLAINGIVAARLGEEFKSPIVCFNVREKEYSGSARSVLEGFNILNVLTKIQKEDRDMFLTMGGHKEAGGLAIPRNVGYLEKFINLFNKYGEEELSNVVPSDKYIDVPIEILTPEFLEFIKTLEPFGKHMEEPVFRSRIKIKNISIWSSCVNFNIDNDGDIFKLGGDEVKCIQYTNKSAKPNFNNTFVMDNYVYITYKPLSISKVRGVVKLIIKDTEA